MGAEKWGRRIRAFRKLKGYTQMELAKALGYSVSVLGEVERGARKPDEVMVQKICDVLGVSYEELSPDK
ncbi:MAG: helix-turn-helix transcriptional regulator [Bacillaceae bacterium]|nr:helix-turn-helix transcriptional regulator [Bacillaceae bacterium]